MSCRTLRRRGGGNLSLLRWRPASGTRGSCWRRLERKKWFYHGVQAATDFVEIRQEGHWKVDLLHHTLNEKGLDTSLAVDMVALQDTYDIALLISGDADDAFPASTT